MSIKISSYLSLLVWSILCLIPTSNTPPPFEGFDKLAHSSAYFILTGLFLYPYRSQAIKKSIPILKISILLGLHGLLIEFAQGKTGYRSFEWKDLVADIFGIILSALFYVMIARRNNK